MNVTRGLVRAAAVAGMVAILALLANPSAGGVAGEARAAREDVPAGFEGFEVAGRERRVARLDPLIGVPG